MIPVSIVDDDFADRTEVADVQNDKLTIDYDEDDGWVTLRTQSPAGIVSESSFALRSGFAPQDVHEAVLATGWVRRDGLDLRLGSDRSCETLRDVIDEMFGYFDAPGVPGSELLEVQAAVEQYDAMQQSNLAIPLYALAWLDIMVRQDIADQARSARNIWTDSTLLIDATQYCDRRVAELVSRYSQPVPSATGRMAVSARTRDADELNRAKIG